MATYIVQNCACVDTDGAIRDIGESIELGPALGEVLVAKGRVTTPAALADAEKRAAGATPPASAKPAPVAKPATPTPTHLPAGAKAGG